MPSEQRRASIYVCGITPYDATHLGHGFTYVTFDVVNRVWRDCGFEVDYVQNLTDLDDPLFERAAATGVDWRGLADSETQLFRSDMEALRVIAPEPYLSVSESLGRIEELLVHLREKGQIYQINDEYPDWYFCGDHQDDFGGVSHLNPEQMLAVFAERGGDPDRTGKRHRLDALVWRQARDGEPSWESSLGRGRPGWHIQCTAIASSTLGVPFDVQGGGSDLCFPHHEFCQAQARAATGKPLARTFIHSAMVGLDGSKMSKSEGNLVKVSQLLGQGLDPMAVRLALLAHHYRSDWSWDGKVLAQAVNRLARWREAAMGTTSVDFSTTADQVRSHLRQDLRSDHALETIDRWVESSIASAGDHAGSRSHMIDFTDALLGVTVT